MHAGENGLPPRLDNQSPCLPTRLADAATASVASTVLSQQIAALHDAVEHAFAPLAAQNAALRNGEIDEIIIRPLAEAVIDILNDLHVEALRCDGMLGAPAERLAVVAERLRQLLAHLDIYEFTAAPGDKFDTRRHQGVARETHHRSKVGTVWKLLKPGYVRRRDGRTIRRASVQVYVLSPPDAARRS